MKALAVIVMASCAFSSAGCQISVPNFFTDHMVLQRDQPIHLWGESRPGERVSITLGEDETKALTDSVGHWTVSLPARAAGGPFDLKIRGSNELNFHDVMIGDIWIAAGQSNMEMPLHGFPGSAVLKNGEQEIAAASHPQIRLLHMAHRTAAYPQADAAAAWSVCTPETARDISAVGYFFSREIEQDQQVAVGLIDATWGGTPAESWISLQGLSRSAALAPVFRFWSEFSAAQQDVKGVVARDKTDDDAARKQGKEPHRHPWQPNPDSWAPAGIYNGMIHPLTPMTIRGVIWYQGETNSDVRRVEAYQQIFTTLIQDWRTQWGSGTFPFIYAQISSFRSTPQENWGMLRDAQRRTLNVTHTAMIPTLDVGDPDNVHPSDKQTVGHRMALAARSLAYGEKTSFSGPLYERADRNSGGLQVHFNHAVGLRCKQKLCAGFEIAGEDHGFVPATAVVQRNSVEVQSSEVLEPRYVRYAWANAPEGNLTDSEGLPAPTFSSEPSPLARTR